MRDLGDLAPDLEGLFRDLDPLIRVGRTALPDLEKFLRAGEPVFESAHVFLPELNPILSLLNFQQATVAGFISAAAADLTGPAALPGVGRYQTQIGVIGPRSFDRLTKRPARENGNAYSAPNATNRGWPLGIHRESFDCKPAGGERKDPDDQLSAPAPLKAAGRKPPCFVAPGSLLTGKLYDKLGKGQAPVRRAPQGTEGNAPTDPNQR